jgi:hypothetical protein
MPPAVAALNIGVGPCWGEACGDMPEAMPHIAPLQPNEAMARITPRRNGTISLDPSFRVENFEENSLDVDSKLVSKNKKDSKKGLGWALSEKGSSPPPVVSQSTNPLILRAA